jgi:probable HAF family extracellular repeat protein
MTDLGTFNAGSSEAYAINDTGQVVGGSRVIDPGGATNSPHAYEYSKGVMHDLELGGLNSIAWDINNAGQIVGDWVPSSEDGVHAFLYQDGRVQDLGNFGGHNMSARSINDRGDVVGAGTTGPGDTVHGFIYIDGQLVDLNTLLVEPDGWQVTQASAINLERQIVSLACRTDNQYDCTWALLSPVPEPATPLLWSGGLLLLTLRWALRRHAAKCP